jgi:hypothetical protein
LGEVDGGILTVRFTYRNEIIRIFGAGYWKKGKIREESVNFFKEEARKEGIPYQRLIRKVVDLYAQHHQSYESA